MFFFKLFPKLHYKRVVLGAGFWRDWESHRLARFFFLSGRVSDFWEMSQNLLPAQVQAMKFYSSPQRCRSLYPGRLKRKHSILYLISPIIILNRKHTYVWISQISLGKIMWNPGNLAVNHGKKPMGFQRITPTAGYGIRANQGCLNGFGARGRRVGSLLQDRGQAGWLAGWSLRWCWWMT